MRLTDELDRLVLDAVGDDFVSLDHIIKKLSSRRRRIPTKIDAELLRSRLVELITDKLISAYLLHADPPYITPVQIGSSSLLNSWFYITQRGRKCLANGARNRALVASGNSEAQSQDPYTPAVNF